MFNKKVLKVVSLLALGLILQGCLSTRQPEQLTAEEKALRNQMMQAMIAKMQANTAAMQAQHTNTPLMPIVKAKPLLTVDELNKQIENLTSNDTAVSFEHSKDGVEVNGIMYLDPEGEIIKVGSNSLSGEFTYLIHTGKNEYIIKYNKSGSAKEAITLAYATIDADGAKINTVTGSNLSGNGIIPTSRGFIVARDTSAFNFDPRDGVTNFSAVENYHIAKYQNGDVASTGYILLEKNPQASTNPVAGLFSSLSDVANAVGLSEDKVSEYLLANVKTGHVVPLDIRTDGKNINILSGCKKKNSLVNECAKSESRESLYKQNGFKNLSHYFWKIYWFNTPDGLYAVAQESGLQKITIVDLNTDKKIIAFERAMGISGFNATQTPEGKITVNAKLGFSTETIEDVVAFFNQQAK